MHLFCNSLSFYLSSFLLLIICRDDQLSSEELVRDNLDGDLGFEVGCCGIMHYRSSIFFVYLLFTSIYPHQYE